MNNEKLIEFLTELTRLTDEYGFEIGGCGCCGSPWVTSDGEEVGVELKYDEEKCCYRINLDSSCGYHKPIYVYGNKKNYVSKCKNNKPYEGTRCISCKYAVRNKEGELNPRDIVCSMWCSDGFEAGDYCSRGEEGVYVSDDNCIQDQEGYEVI